MNYLHLLLLFGVGSIAGFINVMAGGGSSLTLPALIFMGLGGPLANGTNRVAIIVQNFSAITSFRKNNLYQYKTSLKYSIYTLPGAIIGALVAVRVSDILFKRILGVVLIFIVVSMFFSRSYKTKRETLDDHPNWLIYPALVGIGFYGGFLQIGVGFLFMASLYHLLKLDLVLVNVNKVFIIFIYTIPALIIFISTGNVNWKYGLVLAAGMAFGAWWGARVSVRGGEKVIRIILAVAIIIMALRLFDLY